MKRTFIMMLCALLSAVCAQAQNPSLTKEKVLSMTIEELSDLPLEDLMYAVELLEVKSIDELFEMIMNKNVSSASKKEEDSFKSPLSSSVLTREEIRTYGCTTIEEALRLIPGVIVREKLNGVYDVHLRGLDNIPDNNMLLYTENVNTLVMINSRPVFSYCQGATMWETLPVGIEDISRIEVVRGPSSALYGSNAVTGVINIITDKPDAASKFVSGSMQMGSQSSYMGDIAFRRRMGKWSVSASGNFQMRRRDTDQFFVINDTALVDITDPDRDFSKGQWVDMDELADIRVMRPKEGLATIVEDYRDLHTLFPEPDLSRKNMGINGAVSYYPAEGISFDLTGGYQNSHSLNIPLANDFFSLNARESKTGYVDLTAAVRGARLQLNYSDGSQNYSYGTPGFKVRNQQVNANLEYDYMPLPNLSIRPGINYQFNRIGDGDYTPYYYGDRQLSSYLNGDVDLKLFAVTLRGDYTAFERLRAIAALRVEKLNVPDEWIPSWQMGLTYALNDNNTVRAVYSRANRSAIVTNVGSNYVWQRVGMGNPNAINFTGNDEADIMTCDNVEIGYRVRPVKSVLLDAEAFYSRSSDYGALMSINSRVESAGASLQGAFAEAIAALAQAGGNQEVMTGIAMAAMTKACTSRSFIHYRNLPYTVDQMGISVGADWIISEKLMAKAHINVQKTTIDNYYPYDQNGAITQQMTTVISNLYACTFDLLAKYAQYGPDDGPDYLQAALNYAGVSDFLPEYNKMSAAEQQQFLAEVSTLGTDAYNRFGPAMYYAIKYNVRMDTETNTFMIGNADYKHPDMVDNHHHRSTPSVYGMAGLVYKPVPALDLSAYGYFYGKQSTRTLYGTETVDPKFIMNLKVGYRPVDEFEIFFNAHNLFNDNRREFVYTDRPGGIYTVGATFGF